MRIQWMAAAALVLGLAATLSAEKKKESADQPKQELKEGEFVKETPFGPMKQGPPKKIDKLSGAQFVEVEEQGDVVVFRRTTPFGKQVWKTKKSELSELEKQFMERQRLRSKQKAAGDKAKPAGQSDKASSAKGK